ncbi:hypothetical protein LX32DRAFT_682111 [Colletotrichum zoysiae]|uniref:Uncharacterized protein n=1 Tax=Colletotrichum zoysiae TaxID=1216348 RepID=A0AAD9HJ36_9PEZI|nr:hypothetical protein LX32DRAFT_682111 [Colletotrichum zoysiae]
MGYSDATEFGPSPVDDMTSTRGGYEGSLVRLRGDRRRRYGFVKRVIDYVKHHNPPDTTGRRRGREERYRFVWNAHPAQDRAIQCSLCVWDHAHAEARGNETGHSWRMLLGGDNNQAWNQGSWGGC